MRITGSLQARQTIAETRSQMRALDEARRRVATGIDIRRPSDDPVSAAGILDSSSSLRALDQYRKNMETGRTRLAAEESVLEQVSNGLIRARELAVGAVNDSSDAQARDAARAEVDHIVEHLKDLANTQLNGAYMFGGQYADSPPYQGGVWDPTRPPSGTSSIEVGSGVAADTNHSAQEIFIDSDVIDALEALSAALDLNDVPGVQTALGRLDGAFDATQELTAEVGGRTNRLEVALSNLDSLDVTLQTFRSELGDADLAEAVTDLVNRQSTLEAARLANARILGTTLADYLR